MLGYGKLSATVSQSLAQHSSAVERACREIVTQKALIAAFSTQGAHVTNHHLETEQKVAHLNDKITVMKEKHDSFMEEVAQLRKAIRQMATKMRNEFHPSAKKG
jgi:cell division protein FtsL